jgi:peptidyl-tRNA hydrolase
MSQIVQYIIVRGDLAKAWPLGALVAQACHAATAVNYLNQNDPQCIEYFNDLDSMHKVVLEVNQTLSRSVGFSVSQAFPFSLSLSLSLFCQAKDEEQLKKLSKTFEENEIKHKLWIEMPENTPTCVALKPYKKEDVHKFVKSLKLLK